MFFIDTLACSSITGRCCWVISVLIVLRDYHNPVGKHVSQEHAHLLKRSLTQTQKNSETQAGAHLINVTILLFFSPLHIYGTKFSEDNDDGHIAHAHSEGTAIIGLLQNEGGVKESCDTGT